MAWPDDIPRPAPAGAPDPGTSAPVPGSAQLPPADQVAAVKALNARRVEAVGAEDWPAAQRAEADAKAIGCRLNAAGRIASPNALCLALGVRRAVYDDVVRRYAHGRRTRPPRHHSAAHTVLAALAAAGDRRFVSSAPSTPSAVPSPKEET